MRRDFRVIFGLSVLVLGVMFAAPVQAQDKFKVVTTFTVIEDIAKNVAGDAAVVESITKPGAEIHDYQPTPGDVLSFGGYGLKRAKHYGRVNRLFGGE